MSKTQIVVPKHRQKISAKVQALLNVSRASNTIQAYVSDVKTFLRWGGRIPATPAMIAEFLAEQSDTRTFSTLRRKTAAIALVHRELGYVNPCSAEIVKSTLRGIRRARPTRVRQAKPLLASELKLIVSFLEGTSKDRDKAILLLGFAAALRRSELVALNVEDLGLQNSNLVVEIRSSKTDRLKLGRQIIVPPGPNAACPIRFLVKWLHEAGIKDGAVFRGMDRHGNVRSTRLTAETVSTIVKRSVSQVGLDARGYSAHSLRAGYVTSAALRGIPTWSIKKQTGHRTDSSLESYIRVSTNNGSTSLLR